jgi:hypothetical protein
MIELLRNCAHGSEIAVYLEIDRVSGRKAITKATTTSNGIKNLRRELEGWHWYQTRRYPNQPPKCRILHQKSSYLKVAIEFIDGYKGDYRKGLVKNAEIVKSVITQYRSLWHNGPAEKTPIHGDLSIDNVLFNTDGIHIVDWEHFIADGGPWGYDAIYLLFETLWFGMRRRKQPNRKELAIICDSLKRLNTGARLQAGILATPLKFLQGFMTDNAAKWTETPAMLRSKFPILRFTEAQVTLIDHAVCRKL